ncbi:MAG: response regulator transcription factor [Mariprofundales bacterium]
MNILLLDEQTLFRAGMRLILSELDGGPHQIGEAASFDEGLELLSNTPEANLILTELILPGMHGFTSLQHLCDAAKNIKVVVVSSTYDAHSVHGALQTSIAGFLPKIFDAQEFLYALWLINNGQRYVPWHLMAREKPVLVQNIPLSERQYEVLKLLRKGYTNPDIAKDLHLADSTVKFYVNIIFKATHAKTRVEAVQYATVNGWF